MKTLPLYFLSLLAVSSHADTVWLNNGDILSGKIRYLEPTSLVLDSKAAGRITIKRNKIRTLATDKPVDLKFYQPHQGQWHGRLTESEPGTVRTEDGRTFSFVAIEFIAHPREQIRDWVFEGNLDLSFDMQRERDDDSDTVETKLDTRIFDFTWRHGIKGDYLYEHDSNHDRERNYTLEYSLDYFFASHFYWRMRTKRDRDYFDDDRRDTQYGTGPGYQFWDDEQGRFSINVELIRFKFDRAFENDENFGVDIESPFHFNAAGLAWDFSHELFGADLTLFTNGNFYHPNIDGVKYVISGEAGIRYKLNHRLNLSLRSELDQIAFDAYSETNKRHVLGVGYSW